MFENWQRIKINAIQLSDLGARFRGNKDEQLVWNARFMKMYEAENGITHLSLDAISEYQELHTEEEE